MRSIAMLVVVVAACGDNVPPSAPPVVADQQITTPEDTPVSIDVVATAPGGASISLTFAPVAHGTVTQDGHTFAYTPATNYHGTDVLVVTASDGTAATNAAITITVTAVNDAPVAVDDALAANEDTAAIVMADALVANDTDVDGDALTVTEVTSAGGVATLANGIVTFTPNANFVGITTFDYTVSDGTATDTGTVTVTVGGDNDPPVGGNDAVTIAEDTVATIATATLVANDTDVELQTLSVTAVANPSIGTVTLDAGAVTYTPPADFNGAATFDYTVSDGAASATAQVTVTVTPVNDLPVASAATATTDEDAAVTITLTGSDIDSSALTFAIGAGPTHGTLGALTPLSPTTASVTYAPNPNTSGDDAFTFVVNDGIGDSAAATVAVHVAAVNDAPVATGTSATTDEDTAVTVTLAGTDIDGDTLDVVIDGAPAHGALTGLARQSSTTFTATYTPALDYNGDDSFTFHVRDASVSSSVATLTIHITPTNDAPIASAGSTSLDEDGSGVTAMSGTDAEGQALIFAIVTGPAHGTLGAISVLGASLAQVTYTPAANYSGPDSYTFTVSDGSATSAPATHTITVNPVNDAPVASAATVTTSEDTPVTIAFAGTDIDSATLNLTLDSAPAHGTLTGLARTSGTTFTALYTPSPNANGPDSVAFHLDDGALSSASATLTLTISPVNDVPVAAPGASSTPEDTAVAITLVGSDADGDPLTFTIASAPASGTLGAITQLTPTTASVTYTPASNVNGPVSFTFQVNDGAADSAAGTESITITPVNDAPSAIAGAATTAPDVPITLTLRGGDIDGDSLSFAILTGPSHGSLGAITPLTPTMAAVIYTPSPGSVTDDSFTFRTSDGAATSAAASFAVVVVGAECGDGSVEEAETCDDAGTDDGDGCSAICTIEAGYVCTGMPSACNTVCGDGVIAGTEQCDDGNLVDTDGCTSSCQTGRACSTATIPGGSRYDVDPATGHCYVAFDSATATWATAETACENGGGHLATITSAGEQAVVASAQNTAQTPWIGASASAAEGTFQWMNISLAEPSGDPVGFSNFEPGQPDHVGTGPHCLQLQSAAGGGAGQWIDTGCATSGAFGRICELAPTSCGDGVLQPLVGEECDDGNTVSGDGCSATCTAEVFISEYIEGSVDLGLGQIDAFELYNPSVSRVVMPGTCLLQTYTNGSSSRGNQQALNQLQKTMEPHGTLSICSNLAGGTALEPLCADNNVSAGVVNKSFWWFGVQAMTGNDVLVLRCNANPSFPDTVGFFYDVIGQIGNNPGAGGWGTGSVTTSNHTLRRKCGPIVRRTDPFTPYDPTPDWDSFPVDTVDDIGHRSCP
ncbi:MAG: Ig-like domain-containing protein [Kofleriaceae bacterium]